ncbi:putative integral membrane protein [Actinacidiphila reveromycinica]|uniref:Putative integral membrane protein n=1 Tax=Actinacidiphila reveromycinica TaxID=659352 RepID=A0A7U3UZJ8_9ACTN|nr:putative integral membrane protein [Streptomyces sp. SN-593]
MTKFLLSLHVLAALLSIGPVAVAASMFPRALRTAHTGAADAPAASDRATPDGDRGSPAGARTLADAGRTHADAGRAPTESGRAPSGGAPAPSGGVPAPAEDGPAPSTGDRSVTTLRLLHRICRVYAGIGIAVPVLGFATASSLGVLGSGWLITSILLTAVAAALLALLILPAQESALDAVRAAGPGQLARLAGRLASLTGVFNLLWAAVTVLMIVRPGSTTGA